MLKLAVVGMAARVSWQLFSSLVARYAATAAPLRGSHNLSPLSLRYASERLVDYVVAAEGLLGMRLELRHE